MPVTRLVHEDYAVLDADDLVKAQISEEFGGIALGIEEQVQIAAGVLIGDQVRDDIVHETLALVGAADGHTAQCIAKAAACRNDIHIVIIHAAGVVDIGVPASHSGQNIHC